MPLRANPIAKITSDFKMDLIKKKIFRRKECIAPCAQAFLLYYNGC